MVECASVPKADASPRAILPAGLSLRRASEIAPNADTIPTGFSTLDAFLGGLALRHLHLLAGPLGGGVTTLLHGLLAALTPIQPLLLFDSHERFFPPGAAAAGAHLPHILRVPTADLRQVQRALALALRGGTASPLIVWDAGSLPPAALLERLRPLVRASGSALLLVIEGMLPSVAAIDGTTLIVRHERWEHGTGITTGCVGKTIMVAVTDRRMQRSATLPLTVSYPYPLPPLLRLLGKEGADDASTSSRGALAAGAAAPGRRAG